MQLSGMPVASLTRIARHTREVENIPRLWVLHVEHVAGNPATRVSPFVAVLLPPAWHPDGVRQKRSVTPTQP